ncbi:uncharacterized protein [Centruroides vittatus]|uniref:uncharacterized protein isoform X2 n=1 Tax=Centruroides vittatus TaxID=120091 RepID=UPI00350F45DE
MSEMATWGCQAGYLVLRPVGALSRLKTRKKNWYVLDESRGLLAYYKNEFDAKTQSPLGTINVQDAAISLVLDHSNQFIIHSDGKEYLLTAENHKSMMIWVLALQAKRDLWNERDEVLSDSDATADKNPLNRMESCSSEQDMTSKSRIKKNPEKKKVFRTQSLQLDITQKLTGRSHPTLTRMRSLFGSQCVNDDLLDTSQNLESEESDSDDVKDETAATDDNNNRDKKQELDTSESEDDVQQINETSNEKLRLLRRLNSDQGKPENELKDRTSSISCNSSDSAVGHSDSAQSCRVNELELELISTKCELAKALNRESSYKNTIEERNVAVMDLESRLKSLEDQIDEEWGISSPQRNCQKLREKCRILQNHNRFLNEEVLKLSKMHHQEQRRNHTYQNRLQELEEIIDKCKRDYVFLFQSSLKITCNDGPETWEVYLYGGATHKRRVLQLLEEVRRINPSLPTYESLCKPQCYIDNLGFRHSYQDDGYVLHYICRQLHIHYNTQLPTYSHNLASWKKYLRQNNEDFVRTKELKVLVRSGIPSHLRSRVWCAFCKFRIRDVMEEKGPHYYNNLCSLAPESEMVAHHRRQIALDLLRTMPDNIRFCDQNADGVRKMQEVLQAFCLHNPTLGYCQGMNFLAGMSLLFLEPEDAFWCLVTIIERYFTANYFDQNLIGAQADQEVLKDLLQDKLPNLYRHLTSLDIELCTVTLNWFLAIFFDCVPFETLLRIWDCFLFEGPKVLFRFALAILKLQEESLLAKSDTVSVMRQLKASTKLLFDVDTLMKTAFEELRPFPQRKDIAIKQTCYLKTLKEQSKKKELEKATLRERESLFSEGECNPHQLSIECAAVYDKDKLWICHGHQTGAQISKVNIEENIMFRLNIELESRVMCIHALGDEVMLLGTLSHFICAFSTRSRKLLWEIRLNDSVLSLTSHQEDGIQQIYAGLADGTIAVIENIQGMQMKPDAFYIMIGCSPVTCLQLVERRLWCACGNRVIILSARTLDTADQFQTSSNSLDYISMLVPGEHGIWIALRGSSIVQLWDVQTLTCRLLFDVRDNRYPRSPKEEDSQINYSRVTALLPFDGSVLVGTGEGSLIIYDLLSRSSYSSVDDTSCLVSNNNNNNNNSNADKIQEKIQELLEQKKEEMDNRHRNDSGCYTTPIPTPFFTQSRRESCFTVDCLPKTTENEQECDSPSPEGEKSEATSCSTVKRQGSESHHSTGTTNSPNDKCNTILPEKSKYISSNTYVEPCQKYKRKYYKHSHKYLSLLDLHKTLPCGFQKIASTRSADDVRRWTSVDNLSSSIHSDSYEFDDLFIAYTEDEWCRHSRRSSKAAISESSESPLHSLRKKSWSLHFQQGNRSNRIRIQLPSWYKDGLITQSSDNESSVGIEIAEDSKTDSAPSLDNETSAPWLGYDDHSNYQDCANQPKHGRDLLQLGEWNTHHQKSSDSASNVSFSSTEVPYILELTVQEKIKISDKPIKCLLEIRSKAEPIIISCAGCYGDDEAVLKWTKESDNLWTNDPIVEVCPYTNTVKPSPFVRSRMPRRSSVVTSGTSSGTESDGTIIGRPVRTSISSASSANSVFGSGLARVQNMLARVHEKT